MNWETSSFDENYLNKSIAECLNKNISVFTEKEKLQLVLSCIDLTTLEGSDTYKKVLEICQQARSFNQNRYDIPNVAAVCFYPNFANFAKNKLKGTSIKVACVAGAFPSGQSPLDIRIAEVKYAKNEGADEIDMVISRGKFLEGDYDFVFNEIKLIKEACGDKTLKVILETGELKSYANIKLASEIAIAAGADFLKTSTGKIKPAATLEAFFVMMDVIKTHYNETGKMVGIKAAGGISDVSEALKYICLLENFLGNDWMNNEMFRFGASKLANNVLEHLLKCK